MDTVDSILHPYDLTFGSAGNCYVSSQDTNLVTGLQGPNNPLPVASWLQDNYPSPRYVPPRNHRRLVNRCTAGSALTTPPPNVAMPPGLDVSFTDNTDTKVAHSVRGVLAYGDYLFVADEPANAVKIYDRVTGEYRGTISGGDLDAPVQLLLNAGTDVLYISSSGNDSVVSVDLSAGVPSGSVSPTTFIDGQVKHISGMGFGKDGNFYAAERKAKKIKKFPPDGKRERNGFHHRSAGRTRVYYVRAESRVTPVGNAQIRTVHRLQRIEIR